MPLAEIFFVPKADTLRHLMVSNVFNFLALVVFDILGGHKCTLERPAPPDAPSGIIFTHAVYDYITVKFQLRNSINLQLTDSFLYNRFCIERSPKMEFLWDLGSRG